MQRRLLARLAFRIRRRERTARSRRLIASARRELRRLYRREIARLLAEAASRLLRRDAGSALLSLPEIPERRSWRHRVRRCLRLCECDGGGEPGRLLLRCLLDRPLSRWPRPDLLTAAARRGDRGGEIALVHGHALVRARRFAEAEILFRELLDGEPPAPIRWRAWEGLAAAHAGAGRPRLAMGAMEAAADEPTCGLGPLLAGFTLALRAGDLRRCRLAAARIDLLVDPTRPPFLARLRRLRAWARHGGGRARIAASAARLRDGLDPTGHSAAEELLAALW